MAHANDPEGSESEIEAMAITENTDAVVASAHEQPVETDDAMVAVETPVEGTAAVTSVSHTVPVRSATAADGRSLVRRKEAVAPRVEHGTSALDKRDAGTTEHTFGIAKMTTKLRWNARAWKPDATGKAKAGSEALLVGRQTSWQPGCFVAYVTFCQNGDLEPDPASEMLIYLNFNEAGQLLSSGNLAVGLSPHAMMAADWETVVAPAYVARALAPLRNMLYRERVSGGGRDRNSHERQDISLSPELATIVELLRPYSALGVISGPRLELLKELIVALFGPASARAQSKWTAKEAADRIMDLAGEMSADLKQ